MVESGLGVGLVGWCVLWDSGVSCTCLSLLLLYLPTLKNFPPLLGVVFSVVELCNACLVLLVMQGLVLELVLLFFGDVFFLGVNCVRWVILPLFSSLSLSSSLSILLSLFFSLSSLFSLFFLFSLTAVFSPLPPLSFSSSSSFSFPRFRSIVLTLFFSFSLTMSYSLFMWYMVVLVVVVYVLFLFVFGILLLLVVLLVVWVCVLDVNVSFVGSVCVSI